MSDFHPSRKLGQNFLVDQSVVRRIVERAEGILDTARSSGRQVAVEIVANAGGLDLLRAGVSPHAQRIARLRADHSRSSTSQ